VTTAAECQNCGAALAGAYCSGCGQKGDVRVPTLGHVLADALAELSNFDSRIWRSLAALALRPGRLTLAYFAGQRMRYAPPFRMYIVTSVAFFLLFSLARLTSPSFDPEATAESIDEAAASIDARVNAAVDAALGGAGTPSPPMPRPSDERAPPQAEAAELAGLGISRDDDGRWECQFDRDLEPRMRERLEAACRKIESDSGASFARAFADNVPLMMLVFIPLVAAIMKVLYLFARRKYVEHLVFFLHVHTFFFFSGVVVIVLGLAARWLPWLEGPVLLATIAAWIYFPIYVYLAMRRVYAQGHALTAVKYVMLGGSYFFAFLLTLLGLIVYTAVTL
jgi:hypothetical protein